MLTLMWCSTTFESNKMRPNRPCGRVERKGKRPAVRTKCSTSLIAEEVRMRLAYTTLACPGWSVEQVADRTKEYGYDGIELRLLDGELFGPDLDAAQRRRVKSVFAGAELPIVCLDTSVRIAADEAPAEDLRAWIELAGEWGAPYLRVFGGARDDLTQDQSLDRASKALEAIAPFAEEHGIGVAVETHDVFASAVTVGKVIDRVPSPAIGALWDTHHPYRMGELPAQVWEALKGRVVHTHVKDARRNGDGWDLVVVGEGEVPVREDLDLLREKGYDGWAVVEWEKKWHPEIPDPEIALPQHIKVLRQWLGEN
jgi:sugar phosphate isomerase/epimerase